MDKAHYIAYPAVVDTPGHFTNMRRKLDHRYYEAHKQRVENVKPVVDNKAPRTYLHFHLKMKKIQMEQERLATVERNNRILLEKMACIKSTTGCVDNWNNYQPKSLNIGKRNQELVKITLDNQAILNRINATKSIYNHQKWLADYKDCLPEINKK
ncbi:sperm axonemal maintenance protein CFAP97D1-like isoform X2 [Lepisosteus oculatus]|uniref:sperm axonemal maintenance protein CFAP97D1-like isoform X2 n=1 Tax=Lepisosteus oculatus TaxID=7918 RepID=UPI00073FF8B3|nr:PREDICTED: uncharacterized protein C17orf105 homolog isoform X2 [Lepisosteus oculatus]